MTITDDYGKLSKFKVGQVILITGGTYSGKTGFIHTAGYAGYIIRGIEGGREFVYVVEENLDFDKQYYLTKFQNEIRARR